MSRTVVMGCIHTWGSPLAVGSHHLARCFVRHGWRVAYVSAPLTPLHRLQPGEPGLDARRGLCRNRGEDFLGGALTAFVPWSLLAPAPLPFLRSGPVLNHWGRTARPGLPALLAGRGFDRADLVYLDNLFLHPLLGLPHTRSLLRVMDRHDAFPGWGPAVTRLARRVAGAVNAVAYTANGLEDYTRGLGAAHAVFAPNGVDFASFAAPEAGTADPCPGIPRPRAVYAGAMDAWFDADLVELAARRLPQVQFVLLGPPQGLPERLVNLPNVHAPGPVPHPELPAWLAHADAGIIPFDTAGHTELLAGVNPLKLYEYLAAGLPVVATAWRELDILAAPAALARSPEEFVVTLAGALNTPGDPGPRRDFARAHDWETPFQAMLQAVDL